MKYQTSMPKSNDFKGTYEAPLKDGAFLFLQKISLTHQRLHPYSSIYS